MARDTYRDWNIHGTSALLSLSLFVSCSIGRWPAFSFQRSSLRLLFWTRLLIRREKLVYLAGTYIFERISLRECIRLCSFRISFLSRATLHRDHLKINLMSLSSARFSPLNFIPSTANSFGIEFFYSIRENGDPLLNLLLIYRIKLFVIFGKRVSLTY